jgi:hypothetical protein
MLRMKGWQIALVIFASVCAWVAAIGGILALPEREEDASPAVAATRATRATPASPAPKNAELALVSASCGPFLGVDEFTQCKGFVTNLTDEPIDDLQVVIEWLDAEGIPQVSDVGRVEYDPLQPGERSPWTVEGETHELGAFEVKFKQVGGGTIAMRDDRPAAPAADTPIPPPLPTEAPPPPAPPTIAPQPFVPAVDEAPPADARAGCSPAYPDVCIPPAPPDLDCPDIQFRRFRVLPPDPHGFDREGDGVGCES